MAEPDTSKDEYPAPWDKPCVEETYEVDIDPLPQSSGHVLDGGDCGFCCLAGILGLKSILEAYEILESHMPGDDWKKRSSLCINRLGMFLEALGMPSDEYDPPFFRYKKGLAPTPWDNVNWPWGVRRTIMQGSVMLVSVRFNSSVPPLSPTTEDHMVLFNGYRQRLVGTSLPYCKKLVSEIRVSCSHAGRRWAEWDDLLYHHGCHPAVPIDWRLARERTGRTPAG
jgi:hypothetical protein